MADKTTYVLVHGFWLGAWAWDEVVPGLTRTGAEVEAVTLPGLESPTADRRTISLEDHVEHVVSVIDRTPGRIVLVGHSAGGAVVHAAVDRRPTRVAHAVYVDTRPLPDGVALNPTLAGSGHEVPLRAWEDFQPGQLDDLDEAMLEHFAKHGTSHPARAARDPQRLSDVRRYDVPATIITTTSTEATMRKRAADGDPYFTELPLITDLTFIELPTGHYPMFSRPDDLATAIAESSHADAREPDDGPGQR